MRVVIWLRRPDSASASQMLPSFALQRNLRLLWVQGLTLQSSATLRLNPPVTGIK
jgi:hypothetical protein